MSIIAHLIRDGSDSVDLSSERIIVREASSYTPPIFTVPSPDEPLASEMSSHPPSDLDAFLKRIRGPDFQSEIIVLGVTQLTPGHRAVEPDRLV